MKMFYALQLLLVLVFTRKAAPYTDDPDCKVFAVALQKHNGDYDYKTSDITFGDAKKYTHDGARIGGGAYGDVYIGKNQETNRDVVLKIYHKLNDDKIAREIIISQDVCGGDNIAKILDVIEFSDSAYPTLVLERVHGTDHKKLFPKLVPIEVQSYAFQFLRALDYAHSKNIIHYDIKPDNIVIDESAQTLQLIDWGLARYHFPGMAGNVAGTLNYKSPEMLSGYNQFNQSTDMWSFGCIFAEWIFRLDTPIFHGGKHKNQLDAIAEVLGTDRLEKFFNKYNPPQTMHAALTEIHHKKSSKLSDKVVSDIMAVFKRTPSYPRKDFKKFRNSYNEKFATNDAISLLRQILVYDHNERITARTAMEHRFFDNIREMQASAKQQGEIFPPAHIS